MINKEEISKLSSLARIEIPTEEIGQVQEHLSKVVDFISKIKKAPVKEGADEPEHRNVLREDGNANEAGKYSPDLLGQAPELEKGYVKVKKVLK